MDCVLDGFTTCLNFRLCDRALPDKIALAKRGTVLFETRSIYTHNFHSFVYPRDFAFFLGGKSSSCLATFDNISETEKRKQFRKELLFNFGEKLESKSTDLHARTVKLRITNVGDLNFKPIAGVRFPGRVKTNAVVPPSCR